MKIKEILVPQLQGLNLNKKYIEKEINYDKLYLNQHNDYLICSNEGFFKYEKNILKKVDRQMYDYYCMEKNSGSYLRVDNDDTRNLSKNIIYINEYIPNIINSNTLPIDHSVIHFTKYVLKITHKSNIEMIIEKYENIPNKVYFNIINNFSINSVNIRDELNTLISFLCK
jgi:hypothetical protein